MLTGMKIIPTKKLSKKVQEFLEQANQLCLKMAEEAYTRRKWKDAIIFTFQGAGWEFFKCRINDKLKAGHKDRYHWEKEWTSHLGPTLLAIVMLKTTFKDKKKAAIEATQEYIRDINTDKVRAANTMAEYLNASQIKMRKVLNNQDGEDFYDQLEKALRKSFELSKNKPHIDLVEKRHKIRVIDIEDDLDWSGKKRKKKK